MRCQNNWHKRKLTRSTMKKIYTLIAAAAIAVAPLAAEAGCESSSFTVNSHTDLGGGLHRYNVTFCVGSGTTAQSQNTYTWGIKAYGGAQFVNYPSNLVSPLTGANYIGDGVSYGSEYLIYDYDYNNGSNINAAWWACYGGGLCSGLSQTCVTFDITLTGAPTALELLGSEGAGVGVVPYGCNGYAQLTTNFNGLAVELGPNRTACIVNNQSCVTIQPTISGGTPPYSIQWFSNQTTAVISTAQTLSHCPTVSSRYYIVVTDATGSVARDQVYVTRAAAPVANAGTDKTKYIGYGASCVTLSGSATGGTSPYTYAWSSGAATASASVCPSTTTNYTLTVTDSKGCTASDQAIVTVRNIACGNNKVWMCKNNTQQCVNNNQVPNKLNNGWVLGQCASFRVGEDEEQTIIDSFEAGVNIFPNPATNNLTVSIGFDDDTEVTINLVDMSGRILSQFSKTVALTGNELTDLNFDISALPAGLYMVQINTPSGMHHTERVVVSH